MQTSNGGQPGLRRAALRSAQEHYLRGAQLAQAGEYVPALAEMRRAIELQPELHLARLQLGLLHLTMSQPQEALAVWAPLRQLSGGALRCFADGLAALIADEFARCIQLLEAGIGMNTTNAPLNKDMRMIIDRVRTRVAVQKPQDPGAVQPVRTDFSLYDQDK